MTKKFRKIRKSGFLITLAKYNAAPNALLEYMMKKIPRKNTGKLDERFKPYRKTPFDREEKPKVTFDLNDKKTARERQDEESRRKLFMHRWREEHEQKIRQQKQHRNRKNQMQPKTWRDVIRESRPGEYHR